MPKPKSEATLAKEKAQRDAVAAWQKKLESEEAMRHRYAYAPVPAKVGKVLKSPTVVVANGLFALPAVAFIRNLVSYVHKVSWLPSSGLYIAGGRLVGTKTEPYQFVTPHYSAPYRIASISGLEIYTCPGPLDPAQWVLSQPICDEAVAITVPDDRGKFKIYAHKDSWLGRKMSKQPVEGSKVNMDLLTSTDWTPLARFIQVNRPTEVDQRVICDMVKAITKNITKARTKTETKATGTNVPKD